jgi:superfamily II DNA or RNA helicase
MSFRELDINRGYNSEKVDVAKLFFVPILKETSVYRRVSAYYSSDSLKLIAEGLSGMIRNNGVMKLLVSYVMSEEDFKEIVHAKKQPEEVLKALKIDDQEKLKELMKDSNVSALGYLIATNRIDIKFVVCKGQGIFHLKFGIFTDSVGDRISFTGSINETYEGMTHNIEQFKVFRSWIPDELKYLEEDYQDFDNYWHGKIDKQDYLIVDMPEKFKGAITDAYKKFGTDLDIPVKRVIKQLPPPWPHQKTALEKWKENNNMGIIEMATGTGKTNVAIRCIKDVASANPDKLLVIVGCPTRVLVAQWRDQLREFIEDFDIITIGEDETKDSVYRAIVNSQETNKIILGTYASLSKPWFTDTIMSKFNGNTLFIADEAHWLGASGYSKALSEKYDYRLGLTATPVRYFDIEGTNKLINYFKDTVFKYTLKEAIRDGWLTPYDYYMYFAYLSEDETKEYQQLTRRYARKMSSSNKTPHDEDSMLALIAERARIVKKASDKIVVFRQILQYLKEKNALNSLLIYVEDKDQLEDYESMLKSYDAVYRKIDEDTRDDDRNIILNDLSKDKIDCVLAMKVLDEGVDVKRVRRAIFIASSGNSKQFIQRRGRVLRKAEGKKLAEIYDICVLVDLQGEKDSEFKNVEKKVTAGEFKRLAIFSISAHNKAECYKKLENIGETLNIDVFDIINGVREYAN